MQALSLGLYVHVPFCPNACGYCHFYKCRPTASSVKRFLEQISLERERWRNVWENRAFETLYWGGGSPSCLDVDALRTLGHLCPTNERLKEWTVEVSPTSITEEKLHVLKELGVTRLSLGVQSFNIHTLQQLGRKQTPQQVYRAYEEIRTVGFENVNLDLIFPPDFTSLDAWKADLKAAIALRPEHLSTYCLTYENETGAFTPEAYQRVDNDREADFYRFTWEFLEQNGYRHYEGSNFARPGYECRHNVNTWRMQEWLGWGSSAASQFNFRRFQNPCSLQDFFGKTVENVSLTEEDLCKDCLIFGLRMCDGVDLNELQRRFPKVDLKTYQPLWERFEREGWVVFENNTLRCTTKGLLLADGLASELL